MRITIFLLLFASVLGAQNYDLIVTTQNDSIACHIKNITDDSIHFEMKANYKWIMQSTPKSNVVEYSMKTIDSDDFKFKNGSTVILSKRKESNLHYGRLRNSVYASTLGVSYARIIPIKNRFALSLGGGLTFLATPMIEGTLLYGGPKYYFEIGANYIDIGGESLVVYQAGFRYQHPKGFLLRIAPMYFNLGESRKRTLDGILPYISLGYSF